MSQEYQYVCDGCGDVVHGKVNGFFQHNDYIQIKGQICLQKQDPRTKERSYMYYTYGKKDAVGNFVGEELSFCIKKGMPCIQKFLDRRQNEIEFHKNKKKDQARAALRKPDPYESRDQRDFDPRPNRFG